MESRPSINVFAEIVTDPRSLNVTLGSLARFTCEGRGLTLLWNVNGLTVSHVDNENRGIQLEATQTNATTGVFTSVIQIPANTVNNDIRIACTAFGIMYNDMSDTAILRIQGKSLSIGQ